MDTKELLTFALNSLTLLRVENLKQRKKVKIRQLIMSKPMLGSSRIKHLKSHQNQEKTLKPTKISSFHPITTI